MKKKLPPFLAGMLTMALIGSLSVGALAATGQLTLSVDPVNIQVNGQTFQPKDAAGKDVPIFIYDGTTYAPLRALAEAFGLEVGYNADARMATVTSATAASTPPANTSAALIDDSYIKVSYSDVFESEGVSGACYLRLDVENKTNKQIWVSLIDASVNGTSVTITSGTPMVIQPGTNSKSPFIISYSSLGISSVSELKNMKFKVSVMDNSDYSAIETSSEANITF